MDRGKVGQDTRLSPEKNIPDWEKMAQGEKRKVRAARATAGRKKAQPAQKKSGNFETGFLKPMNSKLAIGDWKLAIENGTEGSRGRAFTIISL